MDLLTLEFSRGPLNTLPHFDPWHPTCIVLWLWNATGQNTLKYMHVGINAEVVILTHNSITHDAFLRE